MMRSPKIRLRRSLITLSGRIGLDVRYFLSGGFWLSLPFLVNNAAGLLRSVFFARLLDQAVYGQFGFVNSVANLVGVFSLPGLTTALVETVARGNRGSLLEAARARARWGILATLAMTLLSAYYLARGQTALVIALATGGLFVPITSSFGVVQAYYTGRKRFDLVSIIRMGTVVLSTITILLVLWLEKGLVWLVVADNASNLLLYLLFFASAAREARQSPGDPELLAYGRALTWASAISSVASYLDGVLLGLFGGFVDLAIYNIANVLPKSVKSPTKMLTPLVMPKIAEHPDKPVYTRRTRRHLLHLWLLNVALVVVATVAVRFLIPLLYEARYAASIIYAQLLMLSLIGSGPDAFFLAALQARKQTGAIYRSNIVYSVVQIGTLLALAPSFGVLGIVISRIASRWTIAAYRWRAVTRI